LVEGNGHEGTRKVIDVSGDGPNIGGRPLADARGEAPAKGFTINALAIRRPGGLPGGPGAFVEVAGETRPFVLAARRKLLTEVAGRSVHGERLAARSAIAVGQAEAPGRGLDR
jgi:hypothetical protein